MMELAAATTVHEFDGELTGGMTPEPLDMEESYGLTL